LSRNAGLGIAEIVSFSLAETSFCAGAGPDEIIGNDLRHW
jgi:hypothetical protein